MSEITVLPDGSAFGVMSSPLAETHWLYAEREYEDGADEPKELTAPILNHAEHGNIVEAAARYAVRGATNCGKWPDFDPDALVQNVTYALCGPFNKSAPAHPQSDSVMVPRELLIELRDAANECRNVTGRRHQADYFEALTKSADSLLGGDQPAQQPEDPLEWSRKHGIEEF